MPDEPNSPALAIREIQSDADITAALPLMRCLRERLRPDPEQFVEQIRQQESEGYRLIGGYLPTDNGPQLVALAGVRRQCTTARGPHAFIDDLVTQPDHQSKGYATALLRHIASRAADNGLPKLYLDSRASALSFYDQLGFRTLSSVVCWIDAEKLKGEE